VNIAIDRQACESFDPVTWSWPVGLKLVIFGALPIPVTSRGSWKDKWLPPLFFNQIITRSAIDFLYLQPESLLSIATHPADLSPFGHPSETSLRYQDEKSPSNIKNYLEK